MGIWGGLLFCSAETKKGSEPLAILRSHSGWFSGCPQLRDNEAPLNLCQKPPDFWWPERHCHHNSLYFPNHTTQQPIEYWLPGLGTNGVVGGEWKMRALVTQAWSRPSRHSHITASSFETLKSGTFCNNCYNLKMSQATNWIQKWALFFTAHFACHTGPLK